MEGRRQAFPSLLFVHRFDWLTSCCHGASTGLSKDSLSLKHKTLCVFLAYISTESRQKHKTNKQKPRFYRSTRIYTQVSSAVCPLPWTQNAPKPCPMDSSDRTAHDMCRPIRSLQGMTSKWRSRNHLLWLTMGLPPSTLQSPITQQILIRLQSYWA